MTGVRDVLEFSRNKGLKIGLATNAPKRLIPAVLKKINIFDYFHALSSSEDEKSGKSHPDVYLKTARKLNIIPAECVAIEDSFSSALSTQKAGMKTVVVASNPRFQDKTLDIFDLKINRLSEFGEVEWASIVNH